MKRVATWVTIVGLGAVPFTAPAIAASTLPLTAPLTIQQPASTPVAAGQPNQSCETTPTTPGRAVSAPGSAFNPSGISGTKYAGQQPQNSKNPVSVAQYDVACTKQP